MLLTRTEKVILYILAIIWIILAVVIIRVDGVRVLIQEPIDQIDATNIVLAEDCSYIPDYSNELKDVPREIIQSFISNKWTFDIWSDSERFSVENVDYYMYGGATDYNQKTIWVNDKNSIIHEFGHYLDSALYFPDNHNYIYEIDSENASKIIGNYAKTNSHEYFAAYFAYWIKNQNDDKAMIELQKATPTTYEYFSELEQDCWGLNTNVLVIQIPMLNG